MSPSSQYIEVRGEQDKEGLFQIEASNSPEALGDIQRATLEGFLTAVSQKVFYLYPDTGLDIKVTCSDGDVQERIWHPTALNAA